jgi:D-alanyl-D-alanine carboxypeptidase (penicillin-binding protein 5/6)
MRFKLIKSVLFSFSVLFSSLLMAELPPLPQPTEIIPAPPALAAKSYILIDHLSDYVIAEQDVDKRVEPASLTKMMTVYVADHAIKSNKLKLTDMVFISKEAWQTSGSRMFVDVNNSVSVDDLLKGIIIQSGNDASVALAEHIAGTESAFAELMNFYAKQLGMINTHFVNATGLPDPNHYTTARDMAILAKALIRDFPETYKIYSQKEYTYKNIKQTNRNRLLWRSEWVDGIKTGHTDNAGYCLVASGQKEGMRLIAVVMGANSDSARIDETNKLLAYGFRFFETRKLYPAGMAVKKTRIWMGQEKEVTLGVAEDLYVTIGHGQYDRLKAAINVEKVIKAPAPLGTVLGTIAIQLDDKTIIERPIIALNEIKAGGFFSRVYDRIALTVHTLVDKVTASAS